MSIGWDYSSIGSGPSHVQRIEIGVNLCPKFTLNILDSSPNLGNSRNCGVWLEGKGQLFDRLLNRIRGSNPDPGRSDKFKNTHPICVHNVMVSVLTNQGLELCNFVD